MSLRSARKDADTIIPPVSPSLLAIYQNWPQQFVAPNYDASSSVNAIGAMGTNRLGVSIGNDGSGNPVVNTLAPWGYYTSYSQRHSAKWFASALVNQNVTALDTGFRVLEYAFRFQDYAGRNLIGTTYNPTPFYDGRLPTFATSLTSQNDLQNSNDMSFFLADVQHSLHMLNSSSWFLTNTSTAPFRARLAALLPYIKVAIDWLANPTVIVATGKERWRTLAYNDSINPNRLIQQGLAHYGLGVYFGDSYLIGLGKKIVQMGLLFQCNSYADAIRPPAGIIFRTGSTGVANVAYARTLAYLQSAPLGWGWFSESGGSDSSYNDTNLMFLLQLYPVIQAGDVEFRKQVWLAIERGMRWQLRMLASTGLYSMQDNTRVFNGGENFNGKPKQVDYLEGLFVLEFYAAIARDAAVLAAANTMFTQYTTRVFTPNVPMTLYTLGRSAMLAGTIDLTNPDNEYRVALVQIAGTHNAPYTVNLATDQYLSVIPNAVGLSAFADVGEIISGVTFDPGTGNLVGSRTTFYAIQSMPSLVQIGAVVVYLNTGDATTSPLLAYCANVANLPYGPTGSNLAVDWGSTEIIFTLV